MTDDSSYLLMIAIDLLDEVFAEGRDAWNGINEMEHHDAQGDALMLFENGSTCFDHRNR